MDMGGNSLLGSRILIVEDNDLLAEVIHDVVAECGMQAVGPAAGLESGLFFARETPLDGALLDIDLDGQFCFPICAVLKSRQIPFAFLTGYGDLSILPLEFRDAPLIAKPFDPVGLITILTKMLACQSPGPLTRAASLVAEVPGAR